MSGPTIRTVSLVLQRLSDAIAAFMKMCYTNNFSAGDRVEWGRQLAPFDHFGGVRRQ